MLIKKDIFAIVIALSIRGRLRLSNKQREEDNVAHKTDILENSFRLREVEIVLKEHFEIFSKPGEIQQPVVNGASRPVVNCILDYSNNRDLCCYVKSLKSR